MDRKNYETWKISRLFYLLGKFVLDYFLHLIWPMDNIIFQDYEKGYVRDILLSPRNILHGPHIIINPSGFPTEFKTGENKLDSFLLDPIRFFVIHVIEVLKSISSFRRFSGRIQDFSVPSAMVRPFLANVQNDGLQFNKREHVVSPTRRAI